MKPHEIQEKLGLTRIRDRNWYVQPACATTGDGLYEGLTWLTSNHKSWIRQDSTKEKFWTLVNKFFHSENFVKLKSEKNKKLKYRKIQTKSEKDNNLYLEKKMAIS